jgi:hypothetical protein
MNVPCFVTMTVTLWFFVLESTIRSIKHSRRLKSTAVGAAESLETKINFSNHFQPDIFYYFNQTNSTKQFDFELKLANCALRSKKCQAIMIQDTSVQDETWWKCV